MSRTLYATAACAVISLYAISAHAQQPAPASPVQAAAQAAQAAAAPIPGVCVFSQDEAVQGSVVGKAAMQRIAQIAQQVNAEINGIRTQLETDDKALSAQRATMTQEALQQAANGLQQRAGQFQQLVEVRNQEMELTRQGALTQIGQSLDPLLIDAFSYHKCSILIDRAAVMLAAPAMDITSDAVARLDGKIQTITIDKVVLPANQGGVAAPGAAGPAAAAAPAARAPVRTPTPAAGRAGGR